MVSYSHRCSIGNACGLLSLHCRAVYYCSENCQSADFIGSGLTVDPLRTHEFCCEKMAQYASDSKIVAFPFPWADSEFYFVANYCFCLCGFCILLNFIKYSQNDVVCMTLQQNKLLYSICLLYTSPSPRDGLLSRMPSSA